MKAERNRTRHREPCIAAVSYTHLDVYKRQVVKKPCQISRVGESCGIETLRRALRAAGDVALHALSDNFTVIRLAHMSIIGHETPPFVCILYLLYKLYHT